ncbi:MAG: 2-dehydro-3-deoxy-6-phosphogalactonate aldolase [Roseovarius sp.]|nr:2-dehydro-3-deoxy-6-phosphogalactonate aldolase [Roseovarius sp.]
MVSFEDAFGDMPLIAILRGLPADCAIKTGTALFEAGFRIIEVPLNSTGALESIELLSAHLGDEVLIGAGTVVDAVDVRRVADRGAQIIVAPNLNPKVGRATRDAGLIWCPGIMSPTEAFSALDQGADVLKVFPAELVPPDVISAMKTVLPADSKMVAVGGVTADVMEAYVLRGTDGFGLGSGLYKPVYEFSDVKSRALNYVSVMKRLSAQTL